MRFLLLSTLIAAASSASADPVRLIAPASDETLIGGSTATISWTNSAPLPPGAEEWEAFLSVDGGDYYAVRITPHLDIAIRSFQWQVPNISTSSAQLLIRIGNERDESAFELPARFSIRATPDRNHVVGTPSSRSRAEAARPGEQSVVEWAAGDRHGHRVTLERTRSGDAFNPCPALVRILRDEAAESSPDLAPRKRDSEIVAERTTRSRAPIADPLISADVLGISRRLNI